MHGGRVAQTHRPEFYLPLHVALVVRLPVWPRQPLAMAHVGRAGRLLGRGDVAADAADLHEIAVADQLHADHAVLEGSYVPSVAIGVYEIPFLVVGVGKQHDQRAELEAEARRDAPFASAAVLAPLG